MPDILKSLREYENTIRVRPGETVTLTEPGTFTVIVEPVEEDKVGDLFEYDGLLYVLSKHGYEYGLIALDSKTFRYGIAGDSLSRGCTWADWHTSRADAFGQCRSRFTKVPNDSARARELICRLLE